MPSLVETLIAGGLLCEFHYAERIYIASFVGAIFVFDGRNEALLRARISLLTCLELFLFLLVIP